MSNENQKKSEEYEKAALVSIEATSDLLEMYTAESESPGPASAPIVGALLGVTRALLAINATLQELKPPPKKTLEEIVRKVAKEMWDSPAPGTEGR